MKTLNYSRQREAIYNYLLSTKKHPTAETIFQAVQQDYPKISLATVYRNLTVLEETGQVQRIPCNDAKDHYDANTAEHPHFVCNYCQSVLDLEMDNLEFPAYPCKSRVWRHDRTEPGSFLWKMPCLSG